MNAKIKEKEAKLQAFMSDWQADYFLKRGDYIAEYTQDNDPRIIISNFKDPNKDWMMGFFVNQIYEMSKKHLLIMSVDVFENKPIIKIFA